MPAQQREQSPINIRVLFMGHDRDTYQDLFFLGSNVIAPNVAISILNSDFSALDQATDIRNSNTPEVGLAVISDAEDLQGNFNRLAFLKEAGLALPIVLITSHDVTVADTDQRFDDTVFIIRNSGGLLLEALKRIVSILNDPTQELNQSLLDTTETYAVQVKDTGKLDSAVLDSSSYAYAV